jgi:acyl carrier protein
MKKITKKKLMETVAICTKTNFSEIKNSTNNKNLKSWDSMNHIKIIIELEKLLGIKINFGIVPKLTSVNQILKFLKIKNAI